MPCCYSEMIWKAISFQGINNKSIIRHTVVEVLTKQMFLNPSGTMIVLDWHTSHIPYWYLSSHSLKQVPCTNFGTSSHKHTVYKGSSYCVYVWWQHLQTGGRLPSVLCKKLILLKHTNKLCTRVRRTECTSGGSTCKQVVVYPLSSVRNSYC